jgi:hypothetical protein
LHRVDLLLGHRRRVWRDGRAARHLHPDNGSVAAHNRALASPYHRAGRAVQPSDHGADHAPFEASDHRSLASAYGNAKFSFHRAVGVSISRSAVGSFDSPHAAANICSRRAHSGAKLSLDDHIQRYVDSSTKRYWSFDGPMERQRQRRHSQGYLG